MEAKSAARAIASIRAAYGITCLIAPTPVGRMTVGRDAQRPGTRWALRGLAARDLILAFGLLDALRENRETGRWLLFGALADAADTVAGVAGARILPKTGTAILLAGSPAAIAAALWARVRLVRPTEGPATGSGR